MTIRSEISHKSVLVVIPAFNEQESIVKVVSELKSLGFDCVVVDDDSKDLTAERAKTAGAFVLRLPFNLGVGGALRTGFRFALLRGYEAVVQVDADGQHPSREITQLISTANATGADMVLGSRFIAGELSMSIGRTRRVVMRILAVLASRACGTKITDSTSGFRLIRSQLLSELADKLPSNYLGDTFEALVSTGHAGYEVREISATISERQHGISTASMASAMSFTLKGLSVAILGIHIRLTPKITSDGTHYLRNV
jgi:glycosyltransferase involved in cell wall biosynthesis